MKIIFTAPNYLSKPFSLFFIFLLLISCKKESSNNPQTQPSAYSLTPKPIALSAHCKGYYEYLPEGYQTDAPTTKYPLLIFFHGAGELGTDSSALTALLKNGPLKHVSNGTFPTTFTSKGKKYRFIIIAPQFTSTDSPYSDEVDIIINYIKQNYRVDASRIYLTGLSFGAGVSWNYVGQGTVYAKKIAAMVPIAAYINEARDEFKIDASKAHAIAASNLPIWSTHNQRDNECPLSWITDAYNLLNAYTPVMNPSPLLTVFDEYGHEGWTKTYDPTFKQNNMNIYEWMLQYHR